MPNEMMSASESNCRPNSLVVPGHPRDAAVERVEHHRDADKRRRNRVFAAHRVDDARIAAEQIAQRHQAGQQIHAPPQPPLRDVGVPAMGVSIPVSLSHDQAED